MIKLIHVRGAITPTGNVPVNVLPKLSRALENASLNDFTGLSEISSKGRIEFDRTYNCNSLSPLTDLVMKLQRLLRAKEIKGMNLYGTLMVIMETNDDFPRLYRVTVENGNVTCKEGAVAWKDKVA